MSCTFYVSCTFSITCTTPVTEAAAAADWPQASASPLPQTVFTPLHPQNTHTHHTQGPVPFCLTAVHPTITVSGSSILRAATRFSSNSSNYRKIVPSIMESPNPGRRVRDLPAISDMRPYDKFSERSLVSRSSRGNSPRGGNRSFVDYQASLRIGMGFREPSGSLAAGLVIDYDIFKNSSTGSVSDATEDGPNGTNGALVEGYSAFVPHARNPSNRSLISPSHGSILPAYQGMGEPPVGFSARRRHPRSSTRASQQRGADLGDRTGSHRYSEPLTHQRRGDIFFFFCERKFHVLVV